MAAKPARRKTAKKQQRSNKTLEIARLIRAAIKKPSRVTSRLRPLKQTSLEPLAAFQVGVSSRLDRDVLAHRAREERADMMAKGKIQPPRKAKRIKVSAKKPRRMPKQQVVVAAGPGLSLLRLVYDGVPIVKRKVRHEQQEQASIRAWKGVYPKAIVEVERKVA